MYSSHPLLDRIPARGITKEEHDQLVNRTGRHFTEQIMTPASRPTSARDNVTTVGLGADVVRPTQTGQQLKKVQLPS